MGRRARQADQDILWPHSINFIGRL
jgi:hypothetical protein